MKCVCASLLSLFFLTLPVHAADVLTWHNDAAHRGLNDAETILTPANVTDRFFGKLFSFPTDGYVYAQPLVVSDLEFPGKGKRNAVFVATEHDSVYAFDAAGNSGESSILWQASLIDPSNHITPVPCEDVKTQDLVPEIGITSTPAIDRDSGTIYVVTRTKELRSVIPAATEPTTRSAIESHEPINETHWVQKLHALSLTSGSEQPGSPVVIGDTRIGANGKFIDNTPVQVAGKGPGQVNGIVRFNALREHQRCGLMLDHGRLYVDYSSHGDNLPVHGWVLAFDAKSLHLLAALCTSPDSGLSTTWMAGASPAVDVEGNLYLATGNGNFTANTGGRDFGESVLRVSTTQASQGTLAVADYFTPGNFQLLNDHDLDLGSGGIMLMPEVSPAINSSASTTLPTKRFIFGGKEGLVFLLDANNLGHIAPVPAEAPGHAVQVLSSLGHLEALTHHEINIINTPATFGDWLYYTSRSDPVTQFLILPDGRLRGEPLHRAKDHFNFAPPTPSISANGKKDGIVWVINNGDPATLLAYDASDVSKRLFSSDSSGSRDALDGGIKFSLPTIADGRVFVGTQDNLTVFGLLPAAKIRPADPSDLAAVLVDAHHIDLSWHRHSEDETAFKIERAANDGNFHQIDMTGRGTSSYADRGDRVATDTIYRYRVTAVNAAGESHPIESSRITTPAAPPDPALIAHWTMDEGNGSRVADTASEQPDDGTIHGEVVWAHGQIGQAALGFHGAGVAPGYVAIPDAPKLRFNQRQSFTLSAWVQPAAPPGKWAAVVSHAADQPGGYGLWCDEQNRWCFGTPNNAHALVGGDAKLGWHHLVGVQDVQANRRALYVDGQEVATASGTADEDSSGDFWIGGSSGDDTKYIDARIDDVRLYNRALTSEEVVKVTARHNPASPSKLLADLAEGRPTALRWTLPAAETGALPSTIRVARSIAGAPFSRVARLSDTTTRWEDASPGPDPAACTYRVFAENSAGDSEPATAAARNRSITSLIKSASENDPSTPATLLANWQELDRLLMERNYVASNTIATPTAAGVTSIDLTGADVIRTADYNKYHRDYRLTYTLASPCMVYLCVDQRNLPMPGLPDGAKDFADTHTHLEMGPAGTFEVFATTQPAGPHTLGPQPSNNSFYFLAALAK